MSTKHFYQGQEVTIERTAKTGKLQINVAGKLHWVDSEEVDSEVVSDEVVAATMAGVLEKTKEFEKVKDLEEVPSEEKASVDEKSARQQMKDMILDCLSSAKDELTGKSVDQVGEYLTKNNLPHSIPTIKSYAQRVGIELLHSRSERISAMVEDNKERYKRMKLTAVAAEITEKLGFKVYASSISHRLER